MTVVLTGTSLALSDVVRVARGGERVELDAVALERMQASRAVVDAALARGEPVYGFSTGVGMRKLFSIEEDQARFNWLLIRGHLVAQGPAAPDDVVRATLLKLANMLAGGASGARPQLAERLVSALNDGVAPRVRMLGSVGQADLGPNADLAYGVLEGLEAAGALDLEAFAANPSVLDPAIAAARPYPSLASTISRLRALLERSGLWSGQPRNLQDPLTFRTLPQVLAATRDALDYTKGVVAIELNAHQGNPVVSSEAERVLPAGNFDPAPLAAALDFLRIALAPALTSAGERALKLLQASLTGLPEGLGARLHLAEPALSELGAAVQGIVAEARLLAQPVSFELASTTQHEGIEDRTTMAPLAARRLAEMVDLGARVAAVELVIAAQAIDLRGRPDLGAGTGRAYSLVRECVPFTDAGDAVPPDLEPVVDLVRSGALAYDS